MSNAGTVAGLGSVESLPRIFLQEETLAQSPPNGKEPSYVIATLWAPWSGLQQIQLGLEATGSKAVSRKRLSDTLDDEHLKWCVLHLVCVGGGFPGLRDFQC